MRVSLIVAVADNGVIGRNGEMAWKISSDLKHFRKLTLGKPVVMGRKTFSSLGKPLDSRDNIVLTRDTSFRPEGVEIATGIDQALNIAEKLAIKRGRSELMIIGGAEIYRLTIPLSDRIYLTRVHAQPEGDTYFSDLDPEIWLLQHTEPHKAEERDEFDISFMVYDRRA